MMNNGGVVISLRRLMMSDYSGHDKPFPTWFPYAIGGVIVATVVIYNFAGVL
jgi:hypothetical protein